MQFGEGGLRRHVAGRSHSKGLILRSYGVGNVPQGNQALMDVLAAAVNEGVVVVNTSQCLAGGVDQDTYARARADRASQRHRRRCF